MAYVLDGPRLLRTIAAMLVLPVLLFIGLNLFLGALLFFGVNDQTGLGAMLRFFDLNAEQTVPAWYSTVLLTLAAVVTAAMAFKKHMDDDAFVAHWYGLAAIFLYLSMDEALAIH